MGFYIKYSTHQDGPHDLVTMIRKIRKGSIPPDALVMEESENQAQPARKHPDLHSFFSEQEEDYISSEAVTVVRQLDFGALVAYGWNFFRQNLMSGLLSALAIFATLCYGMLILLAAKGAWLPSAILIAIAASFFLCGFIHLLLRMQRQLPFTFSSVREFYRNHWTNVVLFCIAFSIIHIAGLLLFVVPGVILLSRTAFAPILVTERNFHFWHAIESSYRTVKNHDGRLNSILLSLVGINLVASLLVFPLIITLPITFAAVIELYRQLDFK